MEVMGESAPRRSERWDIRVDPEIKGNSIEYSHAAGVVIRANSIDMALSLVVRGRELQEKYPDNTGKDAWTWPAEFSREDD